MYQQDPPPSDFDVTQPAPPPQDPYYFEEPKPDRRKWVIAFAVPAVILLLALFVVFLSQGGSKDNAPQVDIDTALDGAVVPLGQSITIRARTTDDKGLDRIEIHVNNFSIHTESLAGGEQHFVDHIFQPPGIGVYQVVVTAFDTAGNSSEAGQITFSVSTGEGLPTPNAPTATPAPTDTPVPGVPGPDGCEHNARFVADVTIPDDTPIEPGTEFVKTWRLKNSGTCTWGSGYQFVFVQDNQMGAAASVSVPETPPEATVDVSVRFRAPQDYGNYTSRWRMRTADGRDFGNTVFARIQVAPPPTPTSPPTDTPEASATPELTSTAEASPIPALPADLTIIDLLLQTNHVGRPITLSVAAANLGDGQSGIAVPVMLLLETGEQMEQSIDPMPPGSQNLLTFYYTFDAPVDMDISVSIDPRDEIAESDEDNNLTTTHVVVNPPLYISDTLTATLDAQLDFDGDAHADAQWQLVENTVHLVLQNGAGAVLLDPEDGYISYARFADLIWEENRLSLAELTEGITIGLRTSDGRLGYALVETVLDPEATSARLVYIIWEQLE